MSSMLVTAVVVPAILSRSSVYLLIRHVTKKNTNKHEIDTVTLRRIGRLQNDRLMSSSHAATQTTQLAHNATYHNQDMQD